METYDVLKLAEASQVIKKRIGKKLHMQYVCAAYTHIAPSTKDTRIGSRLKVRQSPPSLFGYPEFRTWYNDFLPQRVEQLLAQFDNQEPLTIALLSESLTIINRVLWWERGVFKIESVVFRFAANTETQKRAWTCEQGLVCPTTLEEELLHGANTEIINAVRAEIEACLELLHEQVD